MKDPLNFADVAFKLKMITKPQFDEVIELCARSKGEDSSKIIQQERLLNDIEFSQVEDIINNSAILLSTEGSEKDLKVSSVYAGKYSICGIIGSGSIGRVLLAYDGNIGREVAIKELVIKPDGKNHDVALARLIREARITGRLEHPGIIPLYEIGIRTDGAFYYVMKRLKGKTLFQAISECKSEDEEMSYRKRIRLIDSFIDLCNAVGYAHSKGIIHRDLKPGNVMIGEFGETVILDWGLAKKIYSEDIDYAASHEDSFSLREDTLIEEVTRHGSILGTPSYMSPEQMDAKSEDVDQRSDVYSLGAMLYVILTGERPYAKSRDKIFEMKMNDFEGISIVKSFSFVPPELAAISEKAMSRDKDKRFSSASEMASELKAYRDGRLLSIYAYSRKELFKRFVEKNKLVLGSVSVVLLFILIALFLSVHFGVIAHQQRLRAENSLRDVTELSQTGAMVSRTAVSELKKSFDDFLPKIEGFLPAIVYDIEHGFSLTERLNTIRRDFPSIDRIQIFSTDNLLFGEFPPFDVKDDIVDKMVRDHLVDNGGSGKLAASKGFKDSSGRSLVIFSMPLLEKNQVKGIFVAMVDNEKFILRTLSTDPKGKKYQLWFAEEDGYILYDDDPSQIGLNLFTGELYQQFPELQRFGHEMMKNEWGIGYYNFYSAGEKKPINKVSAWDTFAPVDGAIWKVVVSFPYE